MSDDRRDRDDRRVGEEDVVVDLADRPERDRDRHQRPRATIAGGRPRAQAGERRRAREDHVVDDGVGVPQRAATPAASMIVSTIAAAPRIAARASAAIRIRRRAVIDFGSASGTRALFASTTATVAERSVPPVFLRQRGREAVDAGVRRPGLPRRRSRLPTPPRQGGVSPTANRRPDSASLRHRAGERRAQSAKRAPRAGTRTRAEPAARACEHLHMRLTRAAVDRSARDARAGRRRPGGDAVAVRHRHGWLPGVPGEQRRGTRTSRSCR